MSNLQMVSLILLWLVIVVEGVLLFLLYRHVGLIYGQQLQKLVGLAHGTKAPPFTATDSRGRSLILDELLANDYTFLIFGSSHCSSCRNLLADRDVYHFLQSHTTQGYFLVDEDSKSLLHHSNGSEKFLEIIAVTAETFKNYLIPATPFAYILNRQGEILAGNTLGGGVQDMTNLFTQATNELEKIQSTHIPLQVNL